MADALGDFARIVELFDRHAVSFVSVTQAFNTTTSMGRLTLIPSYVTRLVRLTFLAPDIQAAILSGRHDPDLTVTRLMADTRFPLAWDEQRRQFPSA